MACRNAQTKLACPVALFDENRSVSRYQESAFIVVLCFALLNGGFAIYFGANEGFGVSSFPVTYKMIDIVRGTLLFFNHRDFDLFCRGASLERSRLQNS